MLTTTCTSLHYCAVAQLPVPPCYCTARNPNDNPTLDVLVLPF